MLAFNPQTGSCWRKYCLQFRILQSIWNTASWSYILSPPPRKKMKRWLASWIKFERLLFLTTYILVLWLWAVKTAQCLFILYLIFEIDSALVLLKKKKKERKKLVSSENLIAPGREGWQWRERSLLISHQDLIISIPTPFPATPPPPPPSSPVTWEECVFQDLRAPRLNCLCCLADLSPHGVYATF